MNIDTADQNQHPVDRLLPMIFGALQGKALALMTELNIADHLFKGAMTIEELATATSTDMVAMDRLVCLLAHLGLVSESAEARFSCTDLGALLQKRDSASFRNYALLTNSDVVLELIGHMRSALVTGKSAFTEIYDEDFYTALQKRPADAAVFDAAMQEISEKDIPEILETYDFSVFELVVDIGGGQGYLLAALLDKYKQLRGTLVELADVAAQANTVLDKHIKAARCQIVVANFLDTLSTDGDLYMMKRVLSHLSDDDATLLLINIRARISAGCKLLIIDPNTESLYGASFNLLMLVVVGGSGVRSEKELSALFSRCGFKYEKSIRLATELCIVEALAI
jgi:O-methyltransferase